MAIDRFLQALNEAVRSGRLQNLLNNVNADRRVYIVTGLAGRPTASPIITLSPVMPEPSDVPTTRQPSTVAPVTNKPTQAVTLAAPEPTAVSPVEPTFPPDVDECVQDPKTCNFRGGYCVNRRPIDGYYACGCQTKEGWLNGTTFDEHGVTSCIDLDECQAGKGDGPCHPNATCVNLSPPDKFTCTCNETFVGDGILACSEVPMTPSPTPTPADGASPVGCKKNSDCPKSNNLCDLALSPPACRCQDGFFQLNGNCFPESECADPSRNNCHRYADCIELELGHVCVCQDGYSDAPGSIAPGTNCAETDECLLGMDTCDRTNEVCINLRPPAKWICVEKTPAPTPQPVCPDPCCGCPLGKFCSNSRGSYVCLLTSAPTPAPT